MTDELRLISAVERFAAVVVSLSDDDLARPWEWRAYQEGVRFAFFRTAEELHLLAARLLAQRSQTGKAFTVAHRALAQYHVAYRDLQALLFARESALLDAPVAGDAWPLRTVLGHTLAAEREMFARLRFAVMQHRQGVTEAVDLPSDVRAELIGSHQEFERTVRRLSLPGVLAYYDRLHKRVLRELADIRDEELDVPSLWWEGVPMSVAFRLGRLGSHLRQHTLQAEAMLRALTGEPSEARRLLRLVYAALAEAESAVIGDWLLGQREQQETAAIIAQRAGEIEALLND
ncbi:MAG: DinB family protein [Anaerolineae bacterium]|nr:MAG: DinB family protein [Anaerolineae bacterium]